MESVPLFSKFGIFFRPRFELFFPFRFALRVHRFFCGKIIVGFGEHVKVFVGRQTDRFLRSLYAIGTEGSAVYVGRALLRRVFSDDRRKHDERRLIGALFRFFG